VAGDGSAARVAGGNRAVCGGRVKRMRTQDEDRTRLNDRLPSGLAPNARTYEAIAELEAGKGKRCASVEALLCELNSED
jgi:hypothetical protein